MKKKTWRILAFILAAPIALGLAAGCSRKKEPPVVLVIIDTLPAGHSSAYGYARSTTPSIEKLAADGVRYEHAISAAPWTLPAIASILTGAYPSRHKAGFHLDPPEMADRRLSKMDPNIATMAEMFSSHGYQTVGFFNNPFVHPDYGLNKGFDTYDYVGGDNLQIRSAAQVASDAIKWLDQNGKKPFFMVVHYFDPHLAYNPPIDFAMPYLPMNVDPAKIPFNPDLAAIRSGRLQLTAEDKALAMGLYDGEVSAVDSQLGVLLNHLRQHGIYDRALIVVTADHGEEFWEHGGFEHGHSLHREVIEVPLVIKYPGLDYAGQTVTEYVSLLDLLPTLAEFLGWPLPLSLDGVSLFPRGGRLQPQPQVIVAENLHYGPQQQAFYADNFKLIVNRDTGKITVYDLLRDPAENKDVFGEAKLPESVKFQVQNIAKNLKELMGKGEAAAANIDPETMRKLRSLGYIGN
jgi:arylsulfatase A-like enzyme